ncbi:MAG TPA: 4-hydroxy-tetrahydrodipicolinate reductase [Chroococcales cyanobacterium]
MAAQPTRQQTELRTVKVVIAGVNGRMGRASAAAILSNPDYKLVGAYDAPDAACVGKDVSQICQVTDPEATGILVSNGFADAISGSAAGIVPDVLLDFTRADAAYANAKLAISHGIRPVVGTSGLPADQVEELSVMAAQKKLGAMIVPNFSVGAVLMMEFARQAAHLFENVEIVEVHHPKKVDAPSGTAMHTADQMSKIGKQFNPKLVDEKELIAGARGGLTEAGVRVHSLRLPGLISHQEVYFGSPGEMLTIKHDSFTTDCFTKGILLAIRSVIDFDRLVVGLDKILMDKVKPLKC